MKKLLMAAAVIALSTVASATHWDWKTKLSGDVYVAGTTTKLSSGTAYLYNSAQVSQLALLQNFYNTVKLSSSGQLGDPKSINNGMISGTQGAGAFEWGSTGDTLSAYFAVINEGKVYISALVTGYGVEVGATNLQYSEKTASQKAATLLPESPTTFGGAGWYEVGGSPIPEPTSGLLMLLGVAGLALKRKRA